MGGEGYPPGTAPAKRKKQKKLVRKTINPKPF